MDDTSKGAELLALLTPVRVDGVTDAVTMHVIGQIDRAIRDGLALIRDPHQSLAFVVGTLSITSSMVGGVAAAMLDLPASDDGIGEGKLAALDCVRAMVTRDRARH